MSERQRSFGNNVELDVAQPTPEAADQVESWPGKRTLTEAMSQSSGTALPADLQRSLEASLGADLGGVRVHTDGAAEKAAAGLHAKAFTIGQAVYFNRGYFDPGTAAGRQLLAHEVAHTVQQRGATTGADALAVSRPGDAHETQAEAFAHTFAKAPGARAAAMTPVSRGVIARAVIQRDLLDGGVPADLGQAPAALNAREPSTAELQAQAQAAIRSARAAGVNSVIAIVGQLKNGATGATRAAIEAAIAAELTAQEKQALGGGPGANAVQTPIGATSNANANANVPAPNANANANANTNAGAPGANANANANTNTGAPGANANANANTNAGAPGANANANGANANANANANTNAPGGAAGAQNENAGGGGAPGAQPANANANANANTNAGGGGAGGALAQPAGAQPAATTEGGHEGGHEAGAQPAAATIAAVPPAAGRQLIEQELAFHDRWKALSQHDEDGVGNRMMAGGTRAVALLSGAGTDVMKGAEGGLTQFLMGQGVKLLTSETALGRVPGIGNIIGGGFAAYNLFSHGGAGAKDMAKEISHGIGGAFSAQNWKDSPFLTAANLVAGIKAVLELVGNVCQILSGLAYAFAAIAALGGLLSVFFPPLAFLLPYIPAALQFGRACGGIATMALAVATGLSPIPPILRALHIVTSSNDPITLVAEEEKFHKEAQGAIANYAAARLNHAASNHAAQVADPNAAPKKFSFYGGLGHEIGESATTVRTSLGTGSSANTRAGLGVQAGELEAASLSAAVGDTSGAQRAGKNYFNPDARAAANLGNAHKAEERLEETRGRQEGRQETANTANAALAADNNRPNRRAAERANTKLAEANSRVETAENGVAMAEARSDLGGRNLTGGGNMGDVGPAALDREKSVQEEAATEQRNATAGSAYSQLRAGAAPVHAERNARGHIQLPDAPASLADVDSLDRQIAALAESEAGLRANAAAALRARQQGTQVASGLQRSAQGVTQHVAGQQARGAANVTRVTAQTTDLQSRGTQASTTAQTTTGQAAGPLQAIAGTARTVDGLLGRVPSNKFFDVSGAKRNVHQFVVGMDQVTGAGPQQAAQRTAANQLVTQRGQQAQQAQQANAAGAQQGRTLAQTITADSTAARSAATQAGEVASGSTERAGQARSQLEQLQTQRQQKWAALLSWAAEHRALREQASAGGGHH